MKRAPKGSHRTSGEPVVNRTSTIFRQVRKKKYFSLAGGGQRGPKIYGHWPLRADLGALRTQHAVKSSKKQKDVFITERSMVVPLPSTDSAE